MLFQTSARSKTENGKENPRRLYVIVTPVNTIPSVSLAPTLLLIL